MANLTNAEIILNYIFPEPKHPNYRGTENVELIWHGEWSDPELRYDGKLFNYWDIEDALWDMYCEGIGMERIEVEKDMDAHEDSFDKYAQENCVNYLEDCIFGGYFDNE